MRKLTLGLVLILSLSLIAGIACGNGGEEGPGVTPSPAFTPTPSPPVPSPTPSTPTPTPTPTPVVTVTPLTYLTHTDEVNGIAVDYPAGWTWADDLVLEAEYAVVIVAFRSPAEEDGFRPHMVVTKTVPPVPVTVRQAFSLAHAVGHQAEEFSGYVSVSDEDITVDGLPAIKHVFTCSEGGVALKVKQFWVVKEVEVWVVRYVTAEASFDSLEPVLDGIVLSFTFL